MWLIYPIHCTTVFFSKSVYICWSYAQKYFGVFLPHGVCVCVCVCACEASTSRRQTCFARSNPSRSKSSSRSADTTVNYTGAGGGGTALFNYVNIMPYKLQNADTCAAWTTLTFLINYSQFKCAHLFAIYFHNYFRTLAFLHAQIVNQTAFVVTKVQFILVKTELVHLGRRRRNLTKFIRE